MKPRITLILFLLVGWYSVAEPATLVNTLPNRPVFSVLSHGVTLTSALVPGEKTQLEPGLFSGLGEKKVPLVEGAIYYMARLGATPRLYVLPPDQTLILNQAGRVVPISLSGSMKIEGVLASGALALGTLDQAGELKAEWDDGTGALQTMDLQGGRVYRLVQDPQGAQTVSLALWE